MNDSLVLLTPLLILPVILLFRFVGCGLEAVGTMPGPPPVPPPPFIPPTPYNQTIVLLDGDLVSYWRLVEIGMGDAKDEKGVKNGVYFAPGPLPVGPPGPPPDPRNPPGSEPADGDFKFGQLGLIDNAFNSSVKFNGGFVQVDWMAVLHPAAFTIEAWVLPLWAAAGPNRRFDHVLMEASEGVGPLARGFTIYANQFDRWQVRLHGDPSIELFPTTPPAPTDVNAVVLAGGLNPNIKARTHIAVTYDGTLRLYLNGVQVGEKAAAYSPVQSPTPLSIGATTPGLSGSAGRTYPFLGRIQEVALYKKALLPNVISDHVKLNKWP